MLLLFIFDVYLQEHQHDDDIIRHDRPSHGYINADIFIHHLW